MPTRHYALEPGGPPRVMLRFDARGDDVSNLKLELDGAPLGAVDSGAQLATEPTWSLPDGSILRLKPGHEPGRAEPVMLTRDGKLLPEPVDPERRLLGAVRFVYLAAALEVALSVLAIATRAKYLVEQLRYGWWSFGVGLTLALFGFLASRRSTAGLALAMALFAGEGLMVAARAVSEEHGPLWPVPLRLFLLLPMARGFSAIRELNRKGALP